MIIGLPYEFAVFYELLEKTEDNYWKYGIFSFFIEDEIYPSKGSNYTLSMAIEYLKDSWQEVIDCKGNKLDFSVSDRELLKNLAHSHGMHVDDDSVELEFPDTEAMGVYLSPLEITDAGFYLFYYPRNKDEEYLIYSSDYGKTAKKTRLKKGTVSSVIAQLPDRDAI